VILPWFLIPGLIGVFILMLKYGIKHGVILPRNPSQPRTNAVSQTHGFPVIQKTPEDIPPSTCSARYRIDGVDRETKLGMTFHIESDSAANAKVKAELEGVIVTSVQKE
jgi:hypothetical protein